MKETVKTIAADRLQKRQAPRQKRAEHTVDAILEAAARLLCDVGFEGVSTNKICAAAGMTPPALYRYFPNKYALMKELGERLMERQNKALLESAIDLDRAEESFATILRDQFAVTSEATGGAWIMRSLHATPLLAAVRRDSHDRATDALMHRLSPHFSTLDAAGLRPKLRLAVELGYAALEYMVDLEAAEREQAVLDAASILAAQAERWR